MREGEIDLLKPSDGVRIEVQVQECGGVWLAHASTGGYGRHVRAKGPTKRDALLQLVAQLGDLVLPLADRDRGRE